MNLRYNRISLDHCVYYKRFGDDELIILLLYVDVILIVDPNKDPVQTLKAQSARDFDMKDLGSANKILGIQIHQNKNDKKIWLFQSNYLKKILQHFNVQDCKLISTLLPMNYKLSLSMCPSNEVERMEMFQV